MFIELVDLLRCTNPHDESWLVAAIYRAEGRVILEGRLGCPQCGAQYAIHRGVVEMQLGKSDRPDAESVPDPWRVAALLDLRPPAAVAVLQGSAAGAADQLLEIFPGSIVAVNPSRPLDPRERLAIVRHTSGVPLRTGVVDAVAASHPGSALISDAARALRAGGRLLAPVTAAVPQGVREIARDESDWVGVREAPAPAVQLTRR